GFSGFGGGGGGGGGGGSITSCTTRSGKDSVFCTVWRCGRNHMSLGMMANAMTRLRKMVRKRRSISSAGDHGSSYRRKYGGKPVGVRWVGFIADIRWPLVRVRPRQRKPCRTPHRCRSA